MESRWRQHVDFNVQHADAGARQYQQPQSRRCHDLAQCTRTSKHQRQRHRIVAEPAPAEIIGRGQNLGTNQATYYAATITRGVGVQLISVVNGKTTVLATLQSKQWLSQQWAEVTLSMVGNDLHVMVYRTDTGQYLDSSGNWQVNPQWAIDVHDSSITGAGMTGLGRSDGIAGNVTFDSFAINQDPARSRSRNHRNCSIRPRSELPKGWSQYSSGGTNAFGVDKQLAVSGPNGLVSNGMTRMHGGRVAQPAIWSRRHRQIRCVLEFLDPHGDRCSRSGAEYEESELLRCERHARTDLQILSVQNGVTTVLSDLTSNVWTNGIWVNVSLTVQGNTLQVELYRLDSGQYLNQDGNWQAAPAIAMSVNDSTLTKTGYAGIVRPASYSGSVYYDNFSVVQSSAPPSVSTPPVVTVPPPPPSLPPSQQPGSVPTPPPNGGGTTPTTNANLPPVPAHYPYIHVAELAYNGTPMNSTATGLLKNSVDLVISDSTLQNQINSVTPNTPQFIYANYSNIYGSELTSWLDYANAHGVDPDDAFLHATQATPFTGASPSSIPVNWFWSVQMGSGNSWTDYTSQAHRHRQPGCTVRSGGTVACDRVSRSVQSDQHFAVVAGATAGPANCNTSRPLTPTAIRRNGQTLRRSLTRPAV